VGEVAEAVGEVAEEAVAEEAVAVELREALAA